MKDDFSNWPGQIRKREMSFSTSLAKITGRRIIIANQYRSTKERRSFQTVERKNNNISDFGKIKCKRSNEICLPVFIIGLQTKIY